MSSKSIIPHGIIKSLKNLEKKIMTYPVESKIKSIHDKYQDQKENRELIVVDKYGNRYYQYYSHHGLPTRRIIHLNQTSFNKWNDDPIMVSWLQRRKLSAPSQEELEKIYIEQEEFQRRCLDWDKKENLLIEEFKKKQKEALDNERKETKAIGEGEKFQPGVWDRTQLVKLEENKELVEGVSRMPGKYIVDFLDEDEKWMKSREKKISDKINAVLDKVDLTKYDNDTMAQKNYYENLNKIKENREKIKQFTNLGKKMIEKEKNMEIYNGFRSRYKDIFNEFNDEKENLENEIEKESELNKEFSFK